MQLRDVILQSARLTISYHNKPSGNRIMLLGRSRTCQRGRALETCRRRYLTRIERPNLRRVARAAKTRRGGVTTDNVIIAR